MLHGHYIELLVWACARREIQMLIAIATPQHYYYVLIFRYTVKAPQKKVCTM